MLLPIEDGITDLPKLLLQVLIEHDSFEQLILSSPFEGLGVELTSLKERNESVVIGMQFASLPYELRLAKAAHNGSTEA